MIRKTCLTILAFILALSSITAQDVEYKDGKMLLDGKPILKATKVSANEYSFYSLENDDELLLFKSFDNETPKYINDDYYILNFLTEKTKVECTDFSKIAQGLGLNSKKNMEKLVTWLLREKVLTSEGKINKDKLEIFHEKYHENIVNRTIRN